MSATSYLRRGSRRLTVWARPLPSILLVGAMRAGTTSLFRSLAEHSRVVDPTHKELHYFDVFHDRGPAWYRAFFPIGPRAVAIEASPSYLNHEQAAARAADLLPDARILVVLRDPVERAWSNYRFRRGYEREHRSFAEAVDEELAEGPTPFTEFRNPAEVPYLSAGLYADQLRRWFDAYGTDGVLVLDAHEVFADPPAGLERVQRFAGLDPEPLPYRRVNQAPSDSVPDDLARRLRSFFAEPDADLEGLLGRRLSWMG